jgi:uncharacterized membrane protein YccC
MASRTLKQRLREEIAQLARVSPSKRPWQMPFAAALCSGLPLLVGAWFDHLDYGLISSLGGLIFLYMPETPMHHRMVMLMACAFGMIASYALGVASHLFPPAMVPALTFTAILVTMVCRYYNLGPPGSFFFIMAAAIGANTPGDIHGVPLKVGLLTMGCLLASLIAFVYCLYILRRQPPRPIPALPEPTFDFVVFDAIVIGTFVGLALALAQLLDLAQAYWVPISCLAVIQGMSLRAVWTRQVHRIAGTAVGLLLAWGLLSLPLDPWTIGLTMIALSFCVEILIVRHYALASIFITPMTILLVEAGSIGQIAAEKLIQARFWDTVLGCLVGLLGGICLHSPRLRTSLGQPLRRLIPTRREYERSSPD